MLAVAVIASLVVVAHGHGAVVNPPYVIIHAFGNSPTPAGGVTPSWHALVVLRLPMACMYLAGWFVSQASQRCRPQLEALERRCPCPATECRVGDGLVPGPWRRRQTLWSQRPSMLLYATALVLLWSSLPVPLDPCRDARVHMQGSATAVPWGVTLVTAARAARSLHPIRRPQSHRPALAAIRSAQTASSARAPMGSSQPSVTQRCEQSTRMRRAAARTTGTISLRGAHVRLHSSMHPRTTPCKGTFADAV